MIPQEHFIIGVCVAGLDISSGNNNPWSPSLRAAFWYLGEVLISTQPIMIIEDNDDDDDDDDDDDSDDAHSVRNKQCWNI